MTRSIKCSRAGTTGCAITAAGFLFIGIVMAVMGTWHASAWIIAKLVQLFAAVMA